MLPILLVFSVPSQSSHRGNLFTDSFLLIDDSIIRNLLVSSSVSIRSLSILSGVLWLRLWVGKLIGEVTWLIGTIRWLLITFLIIWWWRAWLYWDDFIGIQSCDSVWISSYSISKTSATYSILINHVIWDWYFGGTIVSNAWSIVAWGIGSWVQSLMRTMMLLLFVSDVFLLEILLLSILEHLVWVLCTTLELR